MRNDTDVITKGRQYPEVTTFRMTREFRERLTAAAGPQPLAVFIRDAIEAHIARNAAQPST